ncbi:probable G-protein coupled receptor 179 [Hypomesus transpacificus]|uniref:probable G-protein coupled receptor 179 n=1 Tax=Hypomesus transpacificus TaxID=137520 RepID=UPI001F078ED3|nr:probable G-protein coupled receptor 179 [Hypomesus transpacificus]
MSTLPLNFETPLEPAMDALVNTANFLNMIFQASDLRESSVREDMEWYHALVRSLLEADPIIRRALLTFDADPASPVPQLLLRASRSSTPKVQLILLQDLSNAWESLHPPAPAPDDSWFTSFKFPSNNQPTPALSKRVLLNDLNTLDTPKWGQGDSYVTNRTGVRWGDVPYLECEDGRFLPGWLVTLSTSFYGLKPDLTPEFRGVIRVDVNIQDFDVDQCATGNGWFANTHQCNRTTMKCEPIPGKGFQLGQYCCRCKDGYYSPPIDNQDTCNNSSGSGRVGTVCYPILPICLPCWPGCGRCEDGAPCWVQEDRFLRAVVLAVQGFFMLLVFISMLVAYQFRRSRRIRASGLLLLETILFGSLLLYFPVFILYFKPSIFRCILLRWVRMLGFVIVYGMVTLKMYRVLKVFLSRTAQRVPYMSSTHLLRMLGIMVMTVSWFLCAWTIGVLQNRDRNVPLLITFTTSDGQGFSLCDLDRWDYMMAVAELLFLCWGSFLCSAVKPVPSAFHEPRYMGIAVHNELLLSSMFHLLRFVLPSLHPDSVLLLFFTHTHVTITVTLALLFIPKFIHVSRPGREEIAAEVYEDEVDLRRSGSYLNSSFTSAWSDHSLDPEDIRDELKKLYAQLEVHKTKKMTTNNPHLQKKRSSRRGLSRSIIKRITEIPESLSRQCSREDKEKPFNSRSLSHTESCKKTLETMSVNYKDESVWQLSPVLCKSQSEHDHVRDKDHSLHDSIMWANLAKRASQRSETDSLDTAPLVYKSASAHNLTVDSNLLYPDHNKLHKSLSLTSSKAHSLEDTFRVGTDILNMQIKSKQEVTIKDQTTSALQSLSFDKAEICPWELEEQQPTDKSERHVTYALSHSTESKNPDSLSSPLAQHICPWDHLVPPPLALCTTGEPCKDRDDRECEYPGPQGPILRSASGSLMSDQETTAKEQRVFSFRTSTQKWLSVKAFIGSVDGSLKDKNRKDEKVKDRTDNLISLKGQDSLGAGQNPCSNPSVERKTHQKRSMTTDTKPCLVKQAAVRLSSGDSSERSPRRIVIVKSGVYPLDLEDIQKDGMYENVFVSRQNSTHSTNEMSRKARTPLMHRVGGNRIMPTIGVSFGDVCPLDVPGPSHKSPQRAQSTITDICHWEVEEAQLSERASLCPWESQEEVVLKSQDSVRGDVCPWESTPTNTSFCQPSQQKSQLLNRRAQTICPWEISETNISETSKTKMSLHLECPMDKSKCLTKVDDMYENVRPKESKNLPEIPETHKTVRVNVCPWELENISTDLIENGQTNKTTPRKTDPELTVSNLAKQKSEANPWDFPEPPWEEESPKLSLTNLTTKEYFSNETPAQKTDICLWKTGNQAKSQERHHACEVIFFPEPKRHNNSPIDVCPWEPGNTDNPIQTETTKANICKETAKNNTEGDTESNCLWEREDLEMSKENTNKSIETETQSSTEVLSKGEEKPGKQDSAQIHVCPWETDVFEKTEEKLSVHVELCHKELCQSGNVHTENYKRQDSLIQSNVCNLETNVIKGNTRMKRQESNICPWETVEPLKTAGRDGVLTKTQNSTCVEVCPWDTMELETRQIDVSNDTQNINRQDSTRVDVCPWETENPETKRQNSIRVDVCPWETENPETTKRQDSGRECICPWETAEPIREYNTHVDSCLEETTKTKTIKRQESTNTEPGTKNTDVFRQPEHIKQDSSKVDVRSSKIEEPSGFTEDVIQIQAASSIDEIDNGQLAERMQEVVEAKANMSLTRRDALCPWEMEETKPGSISEHDCGSDVFTWEPEDIQEDEEDDDAECAAEAFVFPDDL